MNHKNKGSEKTIKVIPHAMPAEETPVFAGCRQDCTGIMQLWDLQELPGSTGDGRCPD